MNESTIREILRTYIVRELIRDVSYPLTNEEGIISGGLMDSFSLASLGVFIEEQFDVYIPDPELTVTQMDNLDQIVSRVLQG
ncbi:MAG: acyl carrier protein [Anaerolineales bacterium]|uniref:acyl carrier protein n=1 Tax=Promineifilum sp. TaxID=2664178 RepID=UPI001D1BD8DB|nr:acyl carrier protein [Anaerolineales bacterium]MCB8935052.1 acyl carrier protein [Promineifilum sp.]MCO5181049.1 acyl carrier protein [Promineifilum sp.]